MQCRVKTGYFEYDLREIEPRNGRSAAGVKNTGMSAFEQVCRSGGQERRERGRCEVVLHYADGLLRAGQAQQKYGDRLTVISVVNTNDDNPASVKQYATGHKVTYPILFDLGQMAYSYVQKPSMDLPHVYVIDQNGYIRSDYAYGITTRDIFEGHALFTEIDRVLNAVNSSKR